MPRPGFPSTAEPIRVANPELAGSNFDESRLDDLDLDASNLTRASKNPKSRPTQSETSSAEMSLAPTTHGLDDLQNSSRLRQNSEAHHRSEPMSRLTTWGPAGAVIGVPILLMLSATLLIPSESLDVGAERTRSSLFSTPAEFEAATQGMVPDGEPSSPTVGKATPIRPRPRPDAEANVRSVRRGFSPVRDRPEEPVHAVQSAPPVIAASPQQALMGSVPSPLVLRATPAAAPVRPSVASSPPIKATEGEDSGATSDSKEPPSEPPATAADAEAAEPSRTPESAESESGEAVEAQ